MSEQNTDAKSLAQSLSLRVYKKELEISHRVSVKYQREVFFHEKREDIRESIRTLCQWKGVDIIEEGVQIIFTYCSVSRLK